MSGRNPYRLPVDLHRGRSGWQRRLREAVEDGLDFDGDNAVLDAIAEIVAAMKIRRRRGTPPLEDHPEIRALAEAFFNAPSTPQKVLALDLGIADSEVSKWFRDHRFVEEVARLMADRLDKGAASN